MNVTILKPSRRRGVRLDKVSDKSLGFVPAKRVKTTEQIQQAIQPKVRRLPRYSSIRFVMDEGEPSEMDGE